MITTTSSAVSRALFVAVALCALWGMTGLAVALTGRPALLAVCELTDVLRFGGQVMKNVAGYDVSRLVVGALGTLGVITEVALRVQPRPACRETLCWSMSRAGFP